MELYTEPETSTSLADRYAGLWRPGGPTPDVFSFLRENSGAEPWERVEVLLIDQDRRWRTGAHLPAERYLREFPEVAADPELKLDLVYGELRLAARAPRRDLEPFLARFPDLRDALIQQMEVGAWVETALCETAPGSCPRPGGARTDAGGDADPTAAPGIPDRFVVRRVLGVGGMGTVYEAYDRHRGQVVALKKMNRVNPWALYRFKREFRSLVGLCHPNLVTLHELIAAGDQWLLTMELVDGVDFLTHVRAGANGPAPRRDGPPVSLATLRAALRQLAEGVHALHDAGKLHRDIKPSNVQVTPSGRVVLLDFGLAAELGGSGEHLTTDVNILGTLAYMAPEQAAHLPVSPASDWYSVGTMLYEALTGRLPYPGGVLDVVLGKRESVPPPPASLVPGVPDDLDALCRDLIRADPAARPRGDKILARLGREADQAGPDVQRAGPGPDQFLIGRGPHLSELADALGAVDRGQPTAVYVRGRSGSGKSTLIRQFLGGLSDRGGAVILAGRCYERESVPFKALDCLIDELTCYLRNLSDAEVHALLPRDVHSLARVFPVLRRVEALAKVPRRPDGNADPQETRRRAFTALRELLARIGDRRTLVLAVDDMQWGDLDSVTLLADLMRPPDPPVMLFVACFRSEDAASSPTLLQLLGEPPVPGGADRRDLRVAELEAGEARALALTLLGRDDPAAESLADQCARESGGNPLFVLELVQHLQSAAKPDAPPSLRGISLDAVLWARILRLPDDARRLLEVVAVSGQPLDRADAGRAAGVATDDRGYLTLLQAGRLVRSTGPDEAETIDVYHDRIRETILAHLPPAVVRDCQGRLARVLEESARADPEVLAALFHGAGDLDRAGRYYAEAAERAAQLLAFDHAATLYRLALEVHPEEADDCWFRTKLGDVLANAGRGAEAAREYLTAATAATADGASELERRAALQLLISGHVDEGLAVLRAALHAAGLRLPGSPRRALGALVLRRAGICLRSLLPRPCAPAPDRGRDRMKFEICWSAVTGLSGIDPIRGAYFQACGLELALRSGDPFNLTRSIATEAAHVAVAGSRSRRRAARLLGRAEALAAQVARPETTGLVLVMSGVVAFLQGRWTDALRACDEADALFRDRCTGVVWELDTAQTIAMWSLTYMGELGELSRRWPVLTAEARERGDRCAVANLSTHILATLRLGEDRPDAATEELEQVMSGWSRQGFFVQHHHALLARAMIALYRGDGEGALREIAASHDAYAGSLLSRLQHTRIDAAQLHARAALATAAAARNPGPFLRAAERDARQLRRERTPWACALARLVDAAVAGARGDARAADLLAAAAADLAAADMPLAAAAARRQLGALLGGGGRDVARAADDWMTARGVKHTGRMTAMIVPGFPD